MAGSFTVNGCDGLGTRCIREGCSEAIAYVAAPRYERENSQRHLEESRTDRESRLNTASRLGQDYLGRGQGFFLCSPGCPGTHSVDQAGLEHGKIRLRLPQSAGIKGSYGMSSPDPAKENARYPKADLSPEIKKICKAVAADPNSVASEECGEGSTRARLSDIRRHLQIRSQRKKLTNIDKGPEKTFGDPLEQRQEVISMFSVTVNRPTGCEMVSLVPLKEKKLMEVKLGELPSWISMRDFTRSGIVGAFQRGYDRNYKCFNRQEYQQLFRLTILPRSTSLIFFLNKLQAKDGGTTLLTDKVWNPDSDSPTGRDRDCDPKVVHFSLQVAFGDSALPQQQKPKQQKGTTVPKDDFVP
ncbi:hypothetical protein U0070_023287 [Myodes glareolus]|uniref:ATP synthase F(0) complex subunit f, mitochondrial n=1 Tax=Myodes glareolus TaxID=447135 RepID=A0AAW0IDN7_MYOGA